MIPSVLGSLLSTSQAFLVARAAASTGRMFVMNLLPTVCAQGESLIAPF